MVHPKVRIAFVLAVLTRVSAQTPPSPPPSPPPPSPPSPHPPWFSPLPPLVGGCAHWCNAYTCHAKSAACSGCPVCLGVEHYRHCEWYCNVYTCYIAGDYCEGCDVCASLETNTHCEPWCNSFTCWVRGGFCQGCVSCGGTPTTTSPWATPVSYAATRCTQGDGCSRCSYYAQGTINDHGTAQGQHHLVQWSFPRAICTYQAVGANPTKNPAGCYAAANHVSPCYAPASCTIADDCNGCNNQENVFAKCAPNSFGRCTYQLVAGGDFADCLPAVVG